MTNRLCAASDYGRTLTGRGEGKGYCSKHYNRLRRHEDPLWGRPGRPVCSIDGCTGPAKGRGWCGKHYGRWSVHGDPVARVRGEVVAGKKLCAICGEDKPVAEFTRLNDPCRPCQAMQVQAHRKRNPDYWRTDAADARSQRRRAAKRDPSADLFAPVEIFVRDNWTCGICSTPVDRSKKFPDAGSISLDHIVPLSRGGLHTRANTQASHLGCNIRKNDRLVAA